MSPEQYLAQLRNLLATRFPDRSSAERIMHDAGVNSARVELEGSSVNRWFAILREAERTSSLAHLIDVALRDYPEDPTLQEAASRLRRKPPQSAATTVCLPTAEVPETYGHHLFLRSSINPRPGCLTVVCAPPDFGKTTLLDVIARERRGRCIRIDANQYTDSPFDELRVELERLAPDLDRDSTLLIDDIDATHQIKFAKSQKNGLIRRASVIVTTRNPIFWVRSQTGSIPHIEFAQRDFEAALPPPSAPQIARFIEQLDDDLRGSLRAVLGGQREQTLANLCLTDESGKLRLDNAWIALFKLSMGVH